MENSGLDSDMPTRPPQVVTGEAWLRSQMGYVNTMKQNCPNISHPLDEYLTEGANLYSSGQNPSAIGGSSIQPDTSRALKLEKNREDTGWAYQEEHSFRASSSASLSWSAGERQVNQSGKNLFETLPLPY